VKRRAAGEEILLGVVAKMIWLHIHVQDPSIPAPGQSGASPSHSSLSILFLFMNERPNKRGKPQETPF
jgi:hypothetical protein